MAAGTYNQSGSFRVLTALVVWTIAVYQVVLVSKSKSKTESRTELAFSSVLASGAPTPDCSLSHGVGKEECLAKIDAGCPLTFVGPGCGSGDGGCQPEGWCGFTCRRRCKNFDRCFWQHGFGCKQRATASPTPEPPTPAPTPQPPTTAPSVSCEPFLGMDRPTCDSKIDAGCALTWVGPGCPEGGDGGCQEEGYCGFKCRERCTAFDRCKWVDGVGCRKRSTGNILLYGTNEFEGTINGNFLSRSEGEEEISSIDEAKLMCGLIAAFSEPQVLCQGGIAEPLVCTSSGRSMAELFNSGLPVYVRASRPLEGEGELPEGDINPFASSWGALMNSGPSISLEAGGLFGDRWSGCDSDGEPQSSSDCQGWSDSSTSLRATVFQDDVTGSAWPSGTTTRTCLSPLNILCACIEEHDT